MKKNIIIPIVAALMSVVVAVGAAFAITAQKNPYNAIIFDVQVVHSASMVLDEDPEFILKAEFLENNRTSGIFYENENYVESNEETGTGEKEYLLDSTSPKSHQYIIKSQEELDEIYEKCPPVDFEKEMLFVYIVTRFEKSDFGITEVVVENGKAKIDLFQYRTIHKQYYTRRIIVVKTDKIDVTDVEFTLEML